MTSPLLVLIARLAHGETNDFLAKPGKFIRHYRVASGVFMKWVMMLGPAKVGSICTDDVAGLAAGRSLLPSMPGCNHIVQYRQALLDITWQ